MPTTSLPVPVLLGAALLCFGSTRIAPAEPAAVAISKDFLPALEAAPTLDGWDSTWTR